MASSYRAACAELAVAPLQHVVDELSTDTPSVINLAGNSIPIQVLKRKVVPNDITAVLKGVAGLDSSKPAITLNFSYNELSLTYIAPWQSLLPSINLEYLDLTSCNLDAALCKTLVEIVSCTAPNLQYLSLDFNPIGDEGLTAVCQLLAKDPTEETDSPDGVGGSTAPRLAALSVVHCTLGIDSIIRLASKLAEDVSLTYLDLSDPELTSRNEEFAFHIANALRSNKHLTTLKLRKFPHMTDTTVATLCDCILDKEGGFTELDLSGNRLAGPSGVELAKALVSGAGVETLKLSHCRIGDEGAVAIAEALMTGVALRNLDVRHNSIGDTGITALAEAINGIGITGNVEDSPYAGRSALDGLLVGGNDLVAGNPGTTAIGNVVLSRQTTCETDVIPYVVDDVMHLGIDSDRRF